MNGCDAATLGHAAAALRADGLAAEIAAFDVTDRDAVFTAVARIEDESGPIDVPVNNTGIQRRAKLEDYPPET